MFQSVRKPASSLGGALAMGEVVYHSVVRSVRKSHNNAFMAIAMNLLQAVMLVLIFYYREELASIGWGMNESSNLPPKWIAMAVLGSALGLLLVNLSRRREAVPPVDTTE